MNSDPCTIVHGIYLFQIFPLSETHPNVTRGSEEYSAKVSVKDLAVYSVAK